MKEVPLAQAPLLVLLSSGDEGVRLIVSVVDSTPGYSTDPVAFPTDPSLLSAVLNGYSYQVASQFGSINVSLDNDRIALRFEPKGKRPKTGFVNSAVYKNSIESFRNV